MNKTIIQGVVGSHAYGLAREGSDVDKLGVFVAPTLDVAGLNWNSNKESRVTTNPDVTLHEVGKYLRLALKGNPTVLELLFLPEFETVSSEGEWVVDLRMVIPSYRAVRNSYLGYATAQARKLQQRGDSFSSTTKNRTAKHGRHMLRLLRQAQQFAQIGFIVPRVSDPEEYWAFDNMTVVEMLEVFTRELSRTEEIFDRPTCLLPEPNLDSVKEVLSAIRRDNL